MGILRGDLSTNEQMRTLDLKNPLILRQPKLGFRAALTCNLLRRRVIAFARVHLELVPISLCSDFKCPVMPITLKQRRPVGNEIPAANYLLQLCDAPLEVAG
jgi:hypothetical protein